MESLLSLSRPPVFGPSIDNIWSRSSKCRMLINWNSIIIIIVSVFTVCVLWNHRPCMKLFHAAFSRNSMQLFSSTLIDMSVHSYFHLCMTSGFQDLPHRTCEEQQSGFLPLPPRKVVPTSMKRNKRSKYLLPTLVHHWHSPLKHKVWQLCHVWSSTHPRHQPPINSIEEVRPFTFWDADMAATFSCSPLIFIFFYQKRIKVTSRNPSNN